MKTCIFIFILCLSSSDFCYAYCQILIAVYYLLDKFSECLLEFILNAFKFLINKMFEIVYKAEKHLK